MSKGGWSKNAQIWQVDVGVVGGPIEFQSSDRAKLIEVAASHRSREINHRRWRRSIWSSQDDFVELLPKDRMWNGGGGESIELHAFQGYSVIRARLITWRECSDVIDIDILAYGKPGYTIHIQT